MIGSVLKYLTEVNLKDHWTWCTDVSYLFGLKCERQHYISVLSGYIQPLTLLSHESRKWMQNLGCYSSVIQGSLPGRIGKFAMAVMPLPNYSLKICNTLQLDCLRVHVYNPGLIHTLFVNILVLSFFLFSFSAWEVYQCGISAVYSLFKAQKLWVVFEQDTKLAVLRPKFLIQITA